MLERLAAVAALGLAASVAIAGDWVGLDADLDHDGALSPQEVMRAWPEVSTDDFLRMDADGNGRLDERELALARARGVLQQSWAI
ncbi:hypothetical protein AL036_03890 [Salipiger aestuarii]|uniref:EF hand domain-containing protein n=1 Tax=Salipiger aestuarii TaxID=568098 RepID=A0A327YCE4_9RHOB|nr:hypothetical protein [Salipiger aestuarii]EIE51938.1 hypothetical protein C357_06072 [Citreicella sp. 357]KAA8609522.1 hypothetical protein AL036_03890 [Salipiger aestuarii]RAK18748.1 EF hand domain-containing protein [Salipiger aestuarii]